MKCILGKKLGMTQVFREDGTVIPVTRVQAGPCVVTQVKRQPTDRVDALQIGFGAQKLFRLNKAQQGHLKGLDSVRVMRDVRADADHGLQRGDVFTVAIFEPGDKVHVTGTSKGKGFQGVVKRHNFAGSPATHGHKDQLRMPGSIGSAGIGRVFKDMRMPGHMGDETVTVKNLEIVEVLNDTNELLIKGALPGARGGIVTIIAPEGKITIEQPAAPAVEEAVADAPAETENMVSEETTDVAEESDASTEEVVQEEAVSEDAPTEEVKA